MGEERYRGLSKDTLEGILQQRPEIAEEISATLAHRRAGRNAIREEVSDEVLRERVSRTQVDILLRIRQFFALDHHGQGSQGQPVLHQAPGKWSKS